MTLKRPLQSLAFLMLLGLSERSYALPFWDSFCGLLWGNKDPQAQRARIEKLKTRLLENQLEFESLNEKLAPVGYMDPDSAESTQLRRNLKGLARKILKIENQLARQQRRYPAIPMDEVFHGEFGGIQEDRELRIRTVYIPPEQREQYRVQIGSDKILRNAQGEALSGEYFFVLLPDSRLYARPTLHADNFRNMRGYRHSSLSGGLPVTTAGEFTTSGTGLLIKASRRSGHYLPSENSFEYFLKELGEKGYDKAAIDLQKSP